MIKDINIGQYIPGDSFVHKLDSRIKIILTMLYIIDIFIIDKYFGYIFVLLFLVAVIFASKINIKYVFKGIRPMLPLILIMFLMNIFLYPGQKLIFSFGILKVYVEGVNIALFMVIRLILLIVGMSMLTYTTSPIELTDGLETLLSPLKKLKFPAHELAMMMTIALRFIPTLIEETDKIMKAQMARGADFESGNLYNRAKNLIPILVPLFISSFRRADELALAMEARCYRGGEGRTKMKVSKIMNRDYASVTIVIVLMIVTILSRFYL